MMVIPPTKPKITPQLVHSLLEGQNSARAKCLLPGGKVPGVCVLAIRGYRRDTMGRVGVNDANLYDDAAILMVGGSMVPFNSNTDPEAWGWNRTLGKPYAQLKAGLWYFVKGHHKEVSHAFRQSDPDSDSPYFYKNFGIPNHGFFTVTRDDGRGHRYDETGYFAINLHPGGKAGTWSWGCQTLPPGPGNWNDFQSLAYDGMNHHNQRVLPYLLVDGPVN